MYRRWKLAELIFTNLAIAFGTVLTFITVYNSLHRSIIDVVAFSVIFSTARGRRPRESRYPGIPSILDTILRDATFYFIFMFVCQLVLEFFLLLAPVGDARYCPAPVVLTLTPGGDSAHARSVSFPMSTADRSQSGFRRVNTVFVPMMASRLMLSLKKAAMEPFGQWSLSSMTDRDRGGADLVTIQFASRMINVSREVPEPTTVPPNGGEMELEFIPRDNL